MTKKAPHLRIVQKDETAILPDISLSDEDLAEYQAEMAQASRRKPPKAPKRNAYDLNPEWWSPTTLGLVMDRHWDWLYPARIRLVTLIDVTTRRQRGMPRKTVELTSRLAARIGLDRRNKMRELRALSSRGVISFTTDGNRNPIVTWLGLSSE